LRPDPGADADAVARVHRQPHLPPHVSSLDRGAVHRERDDRLPLALERLVPEQLPVLNIEGADLSRISHEDPVAVGEQCAVRKRRGHGDPPEHAPRRMIEAGERHTEDEDPLSLHHDASRARATKAATTSRDAAGISRYMASLSLLATVDHPRDSRTPLCDGPRALVC
jgi:hypothetical protein